MLAQLNPTQTQRRLDNEHKARLARLWPPVQPPRMAAVIEFVKPRIVEPIEAPVVATAPILSLKRRMHPVYRIQYIVADHFGMKRSALLEKSRKYFISRRRQIAMYVAREFTNASLEEIGRRFGGFDHTSVLHAFHNVRKRARQDLEYAQDVAELELKVREALQ